MALFRRVNCSHDPDERPVCLRCFRKNTNCKTVDSFLVELEQYLNIKTSTLLPLSEKVHLWLSIKSKNNSFLFTVQCLTAFQKAKSSFFKCQKYGKEEGVGSIRGLDYLSSKQWMNL